MKNTAIILLLLLVGCGAPKPDHPRGVFAGADRVLIENYDKEMITEIREKKWITDILDAVEISKDNREMCKCSGDYGLLFYKGETCLGKFSIHHRDHIRCMQVIPGDGTLTEKSIKTLYRLLEEIPEAYWKAW